MEGSNPVPEMRILCFGDSLTEGYSQYGLSMTPYSKTLEIVLETSSLIKSKSRLEISTDGASGDQVANGRFRFRMSRQFSPNATTSATRPRYNYTLFLGGTNDLGWGLSASKIWSSIKSITAISLRHSSKVVLFTVPECAAEDEDLEAERDELNRLIRADAEGEKDGRKGVFVFDLNKAMPYHSLSELERGEIWDDGLHFTPRGYEVMGELVARRLIEILEIEEKEGKSAIVADP